ncbi:dihydroneopterin aldolase [Polynucleobacter sp. AP-Sving-400A-A2]|uniref:dihydroneopterin aldolase n=1 Tax=Polynucleobacter sp. AP-Sving-400A-A2 TaxID=2081049 RepID=UPI001BFD1CB3|nr:dihydroneopterin aldolase [Polynucleobacter sp. AP-Sving-400A-A2]QWE15136.1 dihydroneopterin aldolase [Polynucleobacter sp. AP-Sving-400A-A2]
MTSTACIELKDLRLDTQIGTYAPGASIPDQHLLNLTLWISPKLILISEDLMDRVFDYDPLVLEIDRLAADGHYETQERLATRIVEACARYSEIESLEISLRKTPVRESSGVLGIKLYIDQSSLASMRTILT